MATSWWGNADWGEIPWGGQSTSTTQGDGSLPVSHSLPPEGEEDLTWLLAEVFQGEALSIAPPQQDVCTSEALPQPPDGEPDLWWLYVEIFQGEPLSVAPIPQDQADLADPLPPSGVPHYWWLEAEVFQGDPGPLGQDPWQMFDLPPKGDPDLFWLFADIFQGDSQNDYVTPIQVIDGSSDLPPIGWPDLFYLHVQTACGDFELPTTSPITVLPNAPSGSGGSLRNMPDRTIIPPVVGRSIRPRILH